MEPHPQRRVLPDRYPGPGPGSRREGDSGPSVRGQRLSELVGRCLAVELHAKYRVYAPMIQTECKGCGQKLKVPDDMAGKRARCPSCGDPVKVPGASAAASSPERSPPATPPPRPRPAPLT